MVAVTRCQPKSSASPEGARRHSRHAYHSTIYIVILPCVALLSTSDIDTAAAFVARSWRTESSYDRLPPQLRCLDGASNLDGLAVHLRALAYLDPTDGVAGYKIGSSSRGARDSMGPGFRPFGVLRDSRVFPSGSVINLDRLAAGLVEPELCLLISRPLRGSAVSPAEARGAIDAVTPSLEILSRRMNIDGASDAVKLADGLYQWGVACGRPHHTDIDLRAVDVTLLVDGAPAGTSRTDFRTVDDPFTSVARVCRILDHFGLGLEPGQRVITGSIVAPSSLSDPCQVRGDFGQLGVVDVRFERDATHE